MTGNGYAEIRFTIHETCTATYTKVMGNVTYTQTV